MSKKDNPNQDDNILLTAPQSQEISEQERRGRTPGAMHAMNRKKMVKGLEKWKRHKNVKKVNGKWGFRTESPSANIGKHPVHTKEGGMMHGSTCYWVNQYGQKVAGKPSWLKRAARNFETKYYYFCEFAPEVQEHFDWKKKEKLRKSKLQPLMGLPKWDKLDPILQKNNLTRDLFNNLSMDDALLRLQKYEKAPEGKEVITFQDILLVRNQVHERKKELRKLGVKSAFSREEQERGPPQGGWYKDKPIPKPKIKLAKGHEKAISVVQNRQAIQNDKVLQRYLKNYTDMQQEIGQGSFSDRESGGRVKAWKTVQKNFFTGVYTLTIKPLNDFVEEWDKMSNRLDKWFPVRKDIWHKIHDEFFEHHPDGYQAYCLFRVCQPVMDYSIPIAMPDLFKKGIRQQHCLVPKLTRGSIKVRENFISGMKDLYKKYGYVYLSVEEIIDFKKELMDFFEIFGFYEKDIHTDSPNMIYSVSGNKRTGTDNIFPSGRNSGKEYTHGIPRYHHIYPGHQTHWEIGVDASPNASRRPSSGKSYQNFVDSKRSEKITETVFYKWVISLIRCFRQLKIDNLPDLRSAAKRVNSSRWEDAFAKLSLLMTEFDDFEDAGQALAVAAADWGFIIFGIPNAPGFAGAAWGLFRDITISLGITGYAYKQEMQDYFFNSQPGMTLLEDSAQETINYLTRINRNLTKMKDIAQKSEKGLEDPEFKELKKEVEDLRAQALQSFKQTESYFLVLWRKLIETAAKGPQQCFIAPSISGGAGISSLSAEVKETDYSLSVPDLIASDNQDDVVRLISNLNAVKNYVSELGKVHSKYKEYYTPKGNNPFNLHEGASFREKITLLEQRRFSNAPARARSILNFSRDDYRKAVDYFQTKILPIPERDIGEMARAVNDSLANMKSNKVDNKLVRQLKDLINKAKAGNVYRKYTKDARRLKQIAREEIRDLESRKPANWEDRKKEIIVKLRKDIRALKLSSNLLSVVLRVEPFIYGTDASGLPAWASSGFVNIVASNEGVAARVSSNQILDWPVARDYSSAASHITELRRKIKEKKEQFVEFKKFIPGFENVLGSPKRDSVTGKSTGGFTNWSQLVDGFIESLTLLDSSFERIAKLGAKGGWSQEYKILLSRVVYFNDILLKVPRGNLFAGEKRSELPHSKARTGIPKIPGRKYTAPPAAAAPQTTRQQITSFTNSLFGSATPTQAQAKRAPSIKRKKTGPAVALGNNFKRNKATHSNTKTILASNAQNDKVLKDFATRMQEQLTPSNTKNYKNFAHFIWVMFTRDKMWPSFTTNYQSSPKGLGDRPFRPKALITGSEPTPAGAQTKFLPPARYVKSGPPKQTGWSSQSTKDRFQRAWTRANYSKSGVPSAWRNWRNMTSLRGYFGLYWEKPLRAAIEDPNNKAVKDILFAGANTPDEQKQKLFELYDIMIVKEVNLIIKELKAAPVRTLARP